MDDRTQEDVLKQMLELQIATGKLVNMFIKHNITAWNVSKQELQFATEHMDSDLKRAELKLQELNAEVKKWPEGI